MKSGGGGFTISSLARLFLVVDIFRAMLLSATLIGIFCGMATVDVQRLQENLERLRVEENSIYRNMTVRINYYWNRETLVVCIIIGVIICAVEILMALAMDNILHKNLGKANLVWINFSFLGIILRNTFYALVCKHEEYLGLDRMNDLTSTVNRMMRMLYHTAVVYEVMKVLQLITGATLQMEIKGKDESARLKKQIAPKKVMVASKRWKD